MIVHVAVVSIFCRQVMPSAQGLDRDRRPSILASLANPDWNLGWPSGTVEQKE
jgi:hypothetical protein